MSAKHVLNEQGILDLDILEYTLHYAIRLSALIQCYATAVHLQEFKTDLMDLGRCSLLQFNRKERVYKIAR